MTDSEAMIGLPGYEVTAVERTSEGVTISARHAGPVSCPYCRSEALRSKGRYVRKVRHESWGTRRCLLLLDAGKWKCRSCGRGFRERFEGVLPRQRASEPLKREIFQDHWDGISRSRLARREKLGAATVERWFQYYLRRLAAERSGASCPRVLGIDEHFFTRRRGYATTFCNLEKHTVYDVVLGRSEASLEAYLNALKGKDGVRIVCMDLSSTYRSIVRKHFPNARIVADRFHVIRLVNHHFLACWKDLDPVGADVRIGIADRAAEADAGIVEPEEGDPVGARNRGLLSLLRRHRRNLSTDQRTRLDQYFGAQAAVGAVWRFKELLTSLLL